MLSGSSTLGYNFTGIPSYIIDNVRESQNVSQALQLQIKCDNLSIRKLENLF